MLKLKELREDKNVLQKDLAAAINRTRACVSSWEQGKTEPSIDDLIKLADYFGTTVDCLVGKEPLYETKKTDTASRPLQKNLLAWFNRLPEREQYQALGYIHALAQKSADLLPPFSI